MSLTAFTLGQERLKWPFLASWIASQPKPLPESLLALCKPLFCELCNAKMNSAAQAKIHYDGKGHDKKAKAFMSNQVGESESIKADLYCEKCNLSFTSPQHAKQHFEGRNHARKAAGMPTLNKGYFNKETKKWQRNPPSEFDAAALDAQHEALVDALKPKKQFFCDVCQVGATSNQQLEMHLNGKSHKAKLAKGQNPKPKTKPIFETTSTSVKEQSAALVRNKLSGKRDLSAFRTPSGQFYCATCNICVNSESQFHQHAQSKKHRNNGLEPPTTKKRRIK